MKITFLCDKLNIDRGGSNHSLNLIARRLASRGHNVSIVTMNFIHKNSLPRSPPYTVIEDSVTSEGPSRKAKEMYGKMSTYDRKSDVLHVFNPAMLPIAGRYRIRKGNTPIVGRLNTYDTFCTNLRRMDSTCYHTCSLAKKFSHDESSMGNKVKSIPRYFFDTHLMPKLANGVDRFFALSPTVASIYEEIGFEKDRIDVVPNSLDPEFGENAHQINLFDTNAKTLLFVGRLDGQKGVDLLIEALNYVENPSDYSIEIVGDGSDRSQLEHIVERNGLTKQVQFHGWVDYDSLPNYYRSADLFVHPGRWPEPFGRTILEAMQSSIPVVVSNVGAPPWIIDDSKVVFKRNSAQDLARTIEDVLARSPSTITDSYDSRLQRFDPNTVVSNIESKYQELIEKDSDMN